MWILILALLVTAAALLSLLLSGVAALYAAFFGGVIAFLNVLILRCCQQREKRQVKTAQKTLLAMYLCVMQRFVVVTLLFFLGMVVLNLAPLAVLVGFVAGQLSLFMPELMKS